MRLLFEMDKKDYRKVDDYESKRIHQCGNSARDLPILVCQKQSCLTKFVRGVFVFRECVKFIILQKRNIVRIVPIELGREPYPLPQVLFGQYFFDYYTHVLMYDKTCHERSGFIISPSLERLFRRNSLLRLFIMRLIRFSALLDGLQWCPMPC